MKEGFSLCAFSIFAGLAIATLLEPNSTAGLSSTSLFRLVWVIVGFFEIDDRLEICRWLSNARVTSKIRDVLQIAYHRNTRVNGLEEIHKRGIDH